MIDEKKLIEEIEKEIDGVIVKDTYSRGKNAGLRKARILAEEQTKIGGWIPCSERLPDKDGEYICTQKIYNLSNGKLSGKSVELVEFCNGKWRRAKHLKVIAWQPLPEEYHE